MSIQALGYVAIGSSRLEDWSDFATGLLGMQRVERGNAAVAFRMDDRQQRLLVDRALGEGAHVFGWEVADAATLDTLAARLEAASTKVTRGSAALASQRCVRDVICFTDPLGNPLEAFWGGAADDRPFTPGRTISGFRTGALGMGHAVLMVKRLDDALPFYRDTLGFKVSDYLTKPFHGYFFHVNARHHSFAMLETGQNAMHHMMVELFSLDDVGQGYDIALGEKGRVMTTLGRHPNDLVTSFYAKSPSGFMVEYGWGGREVDDTTWQVSELTIGPSLWGHDRVWLPDDQREQSHAMRLKAAQDGHRAPLQVLAGNYQPMQDACPWWDAMKGQS
ncbi:MAG: biphenyl 2,3-dioxygenase [Acetobacteraceae bacterium]|nr:biphenyl 2,3-dioxygenase [Acetobacteraceae bacterium]MSP29562.1 biphenyl 2,3-dioxygenase [Acetobacteraceae bacterium]